jgi:hypothetical protein
LLLVASFARASRAGACGLSALAALNLYFGKSGRFSLLFALFHFNCNVALSQYQTLNFPNFVALEGVGAGSGEWVMA